MSRQTLIQIHVNHQRRKRKRKRYSKEEEKAVTIAEEGKEGLAMKVCLCDGHVSFSKIMNKKLLFK